MVLHSEEETWDLFWVPDLRCLAGFCFNVDFDYLKISSLMSIFQTSILKKMCKAADNLEIFFKSRCCTYNSGLQKRSWMSWWVESNKPTACPGGWMNHMLCGISRSAAGRLRLSAVLIYLALMGLRLRCYIEFWDPQYKDMLAKCGGCSWGPLRSLVVGKQMCRKM